MRDKKCKRQLNLVFNGIWLLTLFIERPLYWVRYKKSGQSSIRDLVSKDVQFIILKIVGALLILKHKGSCRRPINLKCVISSFCSTWKWKENNFWEKISLTLFMKTKVPAVFELGTCESIERIFINCATEIDIRWYKLFHNG